MGIRRAATIELDAIVLDQVRRWRALDEVWTADVAGAIGEPTQRVRESLERLAASGAVVRLTDGNPSRWTCRS